MPTTTAMENLETALRIVVEGDFGGIRDSMDPDVELHEPKGIVGGGTHHGSDEIVENVFSRLTTE